MSGALNAPEPDIHHRREWSSWYRTQLAEWRVLASTTHWLKPNNYRHYTEWLQPPTEWIKKGITMECKKQQYVGDCCPLGVFCSWNWEGPAACMVPFNRVFLWNETWNCRKSNMGLTSPRGVTICCGRNRSVKHAEVGCLSLKCVFWSNQLADLKRKNIGHWGGWALRSAAVPKRAGELCEWAWWHIGSLGHMLCLGYQICSAEVQDIKFV